ncbi:MAG TPA: hypothetical protein VGG39_10360 [Polyangiaceae bacterium]|jgi:hypothetical protein
MFAHPRSVVPRLAATLAVAGIGLTSASPAGAIIAGEPPVYYCPPARFTNTHDGDVIAVLAPPEGVSLLGDVLRAVGMSYVHVAIVSNAAGTAVSQSTWDGSTPSGLYGCAQPLDPKWISNLSPGVQNGVPVDDYGGLAMVLPGAGRANCTGPTDSYHVFGFTHPEPNGTCSEFLRASCGVAVDESRTALTGAQTYAGASELYDRVYSLVLADIDAKWDSWGLALKCGGAGAHTEADRAANQIVNEFLHPGGPCEGYGDGCDDFNVGGWYGAADGSTGGVHPASHPQAIVDTFVAHGGTPVRAGFVPAGACTCVENCTP